MALLGCPGWGQEGGQTLPGTSQHFYRSLKVPKILCDPPGVEFGVFWEGYNTKRCQL